ncbi:MAG: hypothetical protein DMF84_13200 [Acidobacteria bacterium]|nr:MAG: hypothetical protein DMF84_13200 [Acidobacteriota bacterium]
MRFLADDLARDLRHASRLLRRARGFTLTVLAVLAISIGANTAVFSVVNSVLLRPLPYRDADRIVQLVSTTRNSWVIQTSIPKFTMWRDETRVFQSIGAYQSSDPGVNLTGTDAPEHLRAMHVSAGYFDVFGARAALGRTFTPDEDRLRGPHVAVISDGVWKRRFGSDRSLVGRVIPFGGDGYEVIGVLASDFQTEPSVDVYLPLQADRFSGDFANVVRVAARLLPSATLRAAQREMADTAPNFRRTHPFAMGFWEDFSAIPLREALVGDVKPALQMITAAVAFVLLIGCANVANLLLARGQRRRQEIAMRTALGARRSRVVRQLLTESALLAAGGGVLGLIAGAIGLRGIARAAADAIPSLSVPGADPGLDTRVVLFAIGVAVLTAVLFGVLPAINTSHVNLSAAFKESGSPADGGWRRYRAQSLLVIAEVALALVLLVGAGLMIRTFTAVRDIDRGFDAARVLTLDTSLSGTSHDDTASVMRMFRNARQRLDGTGGIAAFAAARALPLEPSFALPFTIARRPLNAPFEGTVNWRCISPAYFSVFRIKLLRGRVFSDHDENGALPVVIINDAFARRYWQHRDPVGERITIGTGAGAEFRDLPRQIVGAVADPRDAEWNRNPEPIAYVPLAQVSDAMTARNNRLFPLTWVARTDVEPRLLSSTIAREVRAATGGLAIARARSMEELLAAPTQRAAFNMTLLTGFAAIALLLAIVGLYGLMSYSVQQRTQEIGIRMALGAVPGDVRNLVLVQGLRLALTGVTLGIGAALVLTRLMVGLVFGVKTYDPGVFAGVAALLSVVALIAAWVPAWRATRINPLEAVRGT